MTTYDAVMIGLIVAGMIWGTIRGFAWQVASLGSLVLGYLCSRQVSAFLAPYMAQYLPGTPAVQRGASMLAAYVAISGAVFFAAWSVRATLKRLKFEAYDRHLGMLLGGAEGALLGVIGTMFVVSLAPQSRAPVFSCSAGRVVAQVMDAAGPILPGEIRNVVAPFWERVRTADADEADVARVADPKPRNDAPDDAAPSLQDVARGARARLRNAVGGAVKSEIQRLGEYDGERNLKRR